MGLSLCPSIYKLHKVKMYNPVIAITNGYRPSIENLSIFVEYCLHKEVLNIESTIQGISDIQGINLNNSNDLVGS